MGAVELTAGVWVLVLLAGVLAVYWQRRDAMPPVRDSELPSTQPAAWSTDPGNAPDGEPQRPAPPAGVIRREHLAPPKPAPWRAGSSDAPPWVNTIPTGPVPLGDPEPPGEHRA